MAERKPIVLIAGSLRELPSGDTVVGASGGSGSSTPQVYVQATAPTVPAGTPYIWVQTCLGADGTDHTIWIGDGL